MNTIYEKLLNISGDGVIRYTYGEGRILAVNQSMLRILGLTCLPRDVEGRLLSDFIHPQYSPAPEPGSIEKPPASRPLEFRFRSASGHDCWVRQDSIISQDEDRQGRIVEALVKDVTDQKLYEQALQDSEERYRRITEIISDYIYTVHLQDGVVIRTSHGPACVRVTGYTSEEFQQNPMLWIAMVLEEDRALVREQAEHCLRGEQPQPLEHRIVHKDGSVRWVRNTVALHFDANGRLSYYDGLIEDITGRKRDEEALKEERRLFIGGPTVVLQWRYAQGLPVLYVSPNIRSQFGYDPELLTSPGFQYTSIIHPEDVQRVLDEIAEFGRSGANYFQQKYRIKNAVGRYRWVEDFTVLNRDARGELLQLHGYVLDITERTEAEAALRESEEQYRSVFEQAADSIVLIDPATGQWFDFNSRAHLTLGYTRWEFQKLGIRDVAAPGTTEWSPEQLTRILRAGNMTFETRHRTKSGEIRDIRVNSKVVTIRGGLYIQSVWSDISDSKRMEEVRRENERIKDIRTLAATIAQSFNHVLSTLSSDAAAIVEGLPPRTDVHDRAQKVGSSARHALHLTTRLMTVAGLSDISGRSSIEPVMLDRVVTDALAILKASLLEKRINVVAAGYEGRPPVLADRHQLLDTLVNLLTNAADALADGGTIRVDASGCKLQAPPTYLNPNARPGTYTILRVRDSGAGISRKVMDHLFEPFFSAHRDGQPSFGLGLTVAQSMVQNWGGWITARSAVGRGTSFHVYIPESSTTTDTVVRRPARVLLMDDDPELLQLMRAALESQGFGVHTADSGTTVLDIFRKFRDEIDVMVMDMIVPGCDSRAVLHEVLEIDPQASVILTTGFSRDFARHYLNVGDWSFLQKPFDVPRLVELIRNLHRQKNPSGYP